MMAGICRCTCVVVALLLHYSHTLVDPAPVSVDYAPTTTACHAHVIEQFGLDYSCAIIPENKETVLREIRSDGIGRLSIDITENYRDFVFGNESFSKDLETLYIYAYYPIHISSGTFKGLERISFLQLSQKYDLLAKDTENTTLRTRGILWTSLQFEPGWLQPLTGLAQLVLSRNSIERFPEMQFCHLKELKDLDLGNNKINSSEELGILSNSSNTPCLPNVTFLGIANNPITNFNINISYNLPLVKILNVSGCALSSIDLGAVLSPYIGTLDISNNMLSSIILGDLGSCNYSYLYYLDLQNNMLKSIPAGLFGCINQLKNLDLSSNLLSEDSLITAGLNTLIELVFLDLSYNNLNTLSANLMGNMVNLQWFYCSGCGLRQIEKDTLINLKNLRSVSLDGNRLHYIGNLVFFNLASLTWLDLSNNMLIYIPDLRGLAYLNSFSVAFNHIKYVADDTFSSSPYLQELSISNNELKDLNHDAYYSLYSLKTLRLNNNFLEEIPSIMLKLKTLETIDLSHNMIRNVQLRKSDTLEWIDLSFNNITKFMGVLSQFKNLKTINLTYNNLTELSIDNFLTSTQPRPQVFLQGNPFHCDCQLEWLLNTKFDSQYEEKQRGKLQKTKYKTALDNALSTKLYYAEVPDLDFLQCITSGSGRNSTSFTEIAAEDFVCPYTEECNDWQCGEYCCKVNPKCPCITSCYPDCSCYHKQNHQVDYMNCTSRNITSLPLKGPTYVKQIYLDGNNLTYLSSDYLIFPQLTELFVNNSNVMDIHAGAFENLKLLTNLHLQENYIEHIESNTFRKVSNLQELYLHNNHIFSIGKDTFWGVSYLRILKLHGNKLQHLDFSLFEGRKQLTELTLYDNPWSCDCEFGPEFQEWLFNHSQIVTSIQHIYCMHDTIHTTQGNINLMNRALISIDFSHICNNVTLLKITEYKHIKSITEVTSLAAAFAIFMLTVVVVHRHLLLIKVLVYNRFGVHLHREENDNIEKLYDAFLTYPRQEDRFVVQHLLPQLEVGDLSYRVCLEGRDWPPGADKAETIIASVQQSKRTILHFNTQWCEFSFEAGHYQVLLDKQVRLIIILTDARLKARMNRTMKMYTRTNACLVVGEKWFWKKLRYYLADNPRGADNGVRREFRLMKVYNNQGQ